METSGQGSRAAQVTSRVPNRCRRLARKRGHSPKLFWVSVTQDQNCCKRRSARKRRGRAGSRMAGAISAVSKKCSPEVVRGLHSIPQGVPAASTMKSKAMKPVQPTWATKAAIQASIAGWSTRSNPTATEPDISVPR